MKKKYFAIRKDRQRLSFLVYTNTTCTSTIYSTVLTPMLSRTLLFHMCRHTATAMHSSSGIPCGLAKKFTFRMQQIISTLIIAGGSTSPRYFIHFGGSLPWSKRRNGIKRINAVVSAAAMIISRLWVKSFIAFCPPFSQGQGAGTKAPLIRLSAQG